MYEELRIKSCKFSASREDIRGFLRGMIFKRWMVVSLLPSMIKTMMTQNDMYLIIDTPTP